MGALGIFIKQPEMKEEREREREVRNFGMFVLVTNDGTRCRALLPIGAVPEQSRTVQGLVLRLNNTINPYFPPAGT